MMRLHVSAADGLSRARMAPMLDALRAAGTCEVTTDRDSFERGQVHFAPSAQDESLALLPILPKGAAWLLGWPASLTLIDRALEHDGPLLLWTMNDGEDFEGVPDRLFERAHRMLRFAWRIDSPWRKKGGFLFPLVRFGQKACDRPLFDRKRPYFFAGKKTSPMRQAWLAALGESEATTAAGLERTLPGAQVTHPSRLSREAYISALENAQMALAPAGHHPLTYRFFEGLVAGALVIAPRALKYHEFLGGLKPWVDFVVVEDASELPSMVQWYAGRTSLAQRIAEAGQRAALERLVTPKGEPHAHLLRAAVASWGLETEVAA
jgi:hypothetical protein